ncbi:ABC transporter ATP-binding protein [Clostridium beijerinckii]|jgi:ABC-type multidrug transport system, ATPase component|uniref:ABC transporter ATP-binding protein n=2 Tax=Clostridium beijerinckii TaxID=1520 RepID=A0A1S8PSG7_CLOBE|nr:ABC transporter ATP-binding protein [Clostridium beijerinckii]ABR32471.1 ABC transporter related [Clostridium beijerinckii NCIMB 8052]AIU01643.1 ABC transporter related protein [Clostridium beijerinckii ATCC 35702]MBF7807850.1 ABC transporter ATP-binding protein [Clostridium beijerinckii]NRT26300.1 ABC-2 type transport system ATP-binding protein [Clostridium beijerinckii]NRT66094.1 ABC-2 type transport system ATP-binding protein [Clostridium beijerinckii]
MSYIELKNVSKVVKDSKILDSISLSLEKGKIYGFLGSNGSGKTMLFRTISGLIRPTSGEVSINDKVIGKEIDFPESCGITIENTGFWNDQTGFDNLKNIASIKNIVDDRAIMESMQRIGLNPQDKRKFRKYSLGMKQKLALVQAFMESQDLIILDEPTNSLDEESAIRVRNILREERSRGATILIASHISEDIDRLVDKKFKVDLGRVYEI